MFEEFSWIHTIGNFIFNALMLALILILLVLVLLYLFQNKLLYMPVLGDQPRSPQKNPQGYRNPKDRGIPYEEIEIKTRDNIKLRGWIAKQKNSKDVPTIVYFHENAGNIGTRVFFMEYYYNQVYVNVVLVAYRGFSDSTGKPSEKGIMIDGETILSHVLERRDINQNKIYLHGRSLGGAVVAYLATLQLAQTVKGIIIENTFTSVADMVVMVFPKIRLLIKYIQTNFWKTIDRIDKIKLPILFIISMKDEIIPPKQMYTLFNKAKASINSYKLVLPEGNHNANWAQDPKTYFQSIKDFIQQTQNLQINQELL